MSEGAYVCLTDLHSRPSLSPVCQSKGGTGAPRGLVSTR